MLEIVVMETARVAWGTVGRSRIVDSGQQPTHYFQEPRA